jgi:hypothetical protein
MRYGAVGGLFEQAANIVAVKTDARLASMGFFTRGLLGTRVSDAR